jgi:hypothetical protein
MDVIREILQRLEQGIGYCEVLFPAPAGDAERVRAHARAFAVSEKAFAPRSYWWERLRESRRFTHASLPAVYRGGRYVGPGDVAIGDLRVPAGSVIDTVDGRPVDDYVASLHDRLWLRWDAHRLQAYSHHSPSSSRATRLVMRGG